MLEKLKKFSRSLGRAYEVVGDNIIIDAMMCVVLGFAGAMIGALVSSSAAGITLGAALAAITFGGITARNVKAKNRESIEDRLDSNPYSGHAFKLVGSRGRVIALQATQARIKTLTKEFMTVAQLPPKVESKIQAYIQDAAEFAAHVRVYSGGQEKDEITFTRIIFNARGQKAEIPFGSVKTELGLRPPVAPIVSPVAPTVPASAPAPQKIKILRPL